MKRGTYAVGLRARVYLCLSILVLPGISWGAESKCPAKVMVDGEFNFTELSSGEPAVMDRQRNFFAKDFKPSTFVRADHSCGEKRERLKKGSNVAKAGAPCSVEGGKVQLSCVYEDTKGQSWFVVNAKVAASKCAQTDQGIKCD